MSEKAPSSAFFPGVVLSTACFINYFRIVNLFVLKWLNDKMSLQRSSLPGTEIIDLVDSDDDSISSDCQGVNKRPNSHNAHVTPQLNGTVFHGTQSHPPVVALTHPKQPGNKEPLLSSEAAIQLQQVPNMQHRVVPTTARKRALLHSSDDGDSDADDESAEDKQGDEAPKSASDASGTETSNLSQKSVSDSPKQSTQNNPQALLPKQRATRGRRPARFQPTIAKFANTSQPTAVALPAPEMPPDPKKRAARGRPPARVLPERDDENDGDDVKEDPVETIQNNNPVIMGETLPPLYSTEGNDKQQCEQKTCTGKFFFIVQFSFF